MTWIVFFAGTLVGVALCGMLVWVLSRLRAWEEAWRLKRDFAGLLPIEGNVTMPKMR